MKPTINYLWRYFEENRSTWNRDNGEHAFQTIYFLMHERYMHLLVTLFTFGGFLLLGFFSLIYNSIIIKILGIITSLLLFCYIHYYWYLENSIQKLYKVYLEYEDQLLKQYDIK